MPNIRDTFASSSPVRLTRQAVERTGHGGRTAIEPVLESLAVADEKRPSLEIGILDPELQGFENAQARPVLQLANESRHLDEAVEHATDFIARHDDRQALRSVRANHSFNPIERFVQDMLIEKQQRRQRPILRAGRDVPLDREVREERVDLCLLSSPGAAKPAQARPSPEDGGCHGRG